MRTRSVAVAVGRSAPVNSTPTTAGMGIGQGLTEHRRLSLDSAHAPAEHPEAVHHRGVRIGADQGVGKGLAVFGGKNHPRQILEVHLVAYPCVGGHHGEAVEDLLCPAQQADSARCCARARSRR